MIYKMLFPSVIAVCALFDFVVSSGSQYNESLQFTKLLQEGLTELNLYEGMDLVAIIGVSGTGKTTLTKFLTNDLLLTGKLSEGGRCIFADNGIPVGVQAPRTSLNTVPNVGKEHTSGTLLIDFPALNGVRKSLNEIANNLFLQKVFQNAGRVKILIVEEFSSVTSDQSIDKFLLTLEHVARLIPDARPLAGSIGLVVAKVDSPYEDDDIIDSIKNLIEETYNRLLPSHGAMLRNEMTKKSQEETGSKIQLAKLLFRSTKNIQLFRIPCRVTSKTCKKCQNPEKLRKLVYSDLKFSASNVSLYRMSTSNVSQQFLKDTLIPLSERKVDEKIEVISTETLHLLDSALSSGMYTQDGKIKYLQREATDIQQFLQEMCARNFSAQMMLNKNWRNISESSMKDLDFELEMLQFFYASIDEDVNEKLMNCSVVQMAKVAQKSSVLLDELNSTAESSICIDAISQASAVNSITDATFDENQESKFIPSTQVIWGRGSYPNQVNYQDNDVLYVTGKIVFLSNITRAQLDGAKRLIYVIASKAISVDESISLEDTHIVLRAPVIEVVGRILFKMAGINGSAQGEHGISPGSVTIAAETIRNGANWTIQSHGGNGVHGDDGPDGTDGKDAVLGHPIRDFLWCLRDHIEDNEHCNVKYPGRQINLTSFERNESISAEAYALNNGTAPGNGGRGNDGGRGGKSGAVSVKFTIGTSPQVTQTDGRSGTGGAGGSPGSEACISRKFILKCDLHMRSWRMDKCKDLAVEDGCIDISKGVRGSPGITPNATLNYKYPRPDENAHNGAEAYLLHALVTEQKGNGRSILDNIPQT